MELTGCSARLVVGGEGKERTQVVGMSGMHSRHWRCGSPQEVMVPPGLLVHALTLRATFQEVLRWGTEPPLSSQ